MEVEEREVTLLGDDGAQVARWTQPAVGAHRPELHRSRDGELALVAVEEVITAVRLRDGETVGAMPAGRGGTRSVPIDAEWTLEVAGELTLDEGHTPAHGCSVGFWFESEPEPGEIERLRAERADAARAPFHRRVALGTIVVHESHASPHDGGEVLLWPPIVGPQGVLLRHARVADDGNHNDVDPQRPWLVRPDATVTQLPFELGVSPLLALPDGRWLLPGGDTLWRDDYDEPLHILDATGTTTPLLVAGEPVNGTRVLRELAPERLCPVDPDQDVPWWPISARLDGDELLLAIELHDYDADTVSVVAAALPLTGTAAIRLAAEHGPRPRLGSAVAA